MSQLKNYHCDDPGEQFRSGGWQSSFCMCVSVCEKEEEEEGVKEKQRGGGHTR